MRIEIDTVKDSSEDIQKAVQLLQSLQENTISQQEISQQEPSSESAEAFTTMFSAQPKVKEENANIETY